MAFLPKLIKRSRTSPSNDFWYNSFGGGIKTPSGKAVNPYNAMTFSTVYACITLISETLASLPLILYRRNKDGTRERAVDKSLYYLLHDSPNSETTSFNWVEFNQSSILRLGNTYNDIIRNGRNEILSIEQISADVKVDRLNNGNIQYSWTDENTNTIQTRRFDQVFHIPGWGYNGIVGFSPITTARNAIGLGLSVEEFGALYFGQGSTPTGVLEMEEWLGDNAKEWSDAFKQQYAGLGKSHSVMVLEGGLKYKPLAIPLNDAQFLATREFQKKEICAFFKCPERKVGISNTATQSSSEQDDIDFLKTTMHPWIRRWEQYISFKLLTEQERKQGYYAEFLVDELLRTDSASRGAFYKSLFDMAAINPNEIRAKENLDPIADGDTYFVPLNLVPLDKARDVFEKQADMIDNNVNTETEPTEDEEPKTIEEEVKALRARELRGVKARDNRVKVFEPLILAAAESVVNREVKSWKKQLEKKDFLSSIENKLDEFYAKQEVFVRDRLGPVFSALALDIYYEVKQEIKLSDDFDIDKYISDYMDIYVREYVDSSRGQIVNIAKGDDPEANLSKRFDEWRDTRPEKIATNESSNIANGVFAYGALFSGLSLVWRTRGKETCPYCKRLEGRKIRRGQNFVPAGATIQISTGGTMTLRRTKKHPPLHAKCDCYTGVALF